MNGENCCVTHCDAPDHDARWAGVSTAMHGGWQGGWWLVWPDTMPCPVCETRAVGDGEGRAKERAYVVDYLDRAVDVEHAAHEWDGGAALMACLDAIREGAHVRVDR